MVYLEWNFEETVLPLALRGLAAAVAAACFIFWPALICFARAADQVRIACRETRASQEVQIRRLIRNYKDDTLGRISLISQVLAKLALLFIYPLRKRSIFVIRVSRCSLLGDF